MKNKCQRIKLLAEYRSLRWTGAALFKIMVWLNAANTQLLHLHRKSDGKFPELLTLFDQIGKLHCAFNRMFNRCVQRCESAMWREFELRMVRQKNEPLLQFARVLRETKPSDPDSY